MRNPLTALERGGLETIYGDAAPAQLARYRAAYRTFIALYGPGPVHVFRAPGRVNLIGEHTDYNHGYVLPVALDRDVLLLARPLAEPTVYLHNSEAHFAAATFALEREIAPASAGDWTNYIRGAAQMVVGQLGEAVRGMQALVEAAPPFGVPRGAGVSSSSALTVAAALALALLNDWQPEPVQFARLCSEAEWYVGTRGGIMDQFCALLARAGHALFLDCRPLSPDRYRHDHVPLPSDYRLLVCDSGVHHTNVRGEFNLRVAACRTGVACLRRHHAGITHLRDVQTVDWDNLAPWLPEVMSVDEARAIGADLDDLPLPTPDAGLRVRACCRHVHSENARVLAAVAALQRGEIATIGRLLDEAHASARDDYDISCPELEALVEAARSTAGTLGARLTGAGWGGCIVALVHRDAIEEFTAQVSNRYHAATGRVASIFACRAGGGAGLVAVL